MLFFLISCFFFILLSKSLLWPFPTWKCEMKMQPLLWFLGELFLSFLLSFKTTRITFDFFPIPTIKPSMNKPISPKIENVENKGGLSLLDLPDLPLDCILERLSPAGFSSMAAVCKSLRDRCRSDHLLENHMKQKWGRVIGYASFREIASRMRPITSNRKERLFRYLSSFWPYSWHMPKTDNYSALRSSLPVDSIMVWYFSLESGKFWFPAQVFNRENGNVGFMLSCYDAELCYDLSTDTFRARYAVQGRQTGEENIEWSRVRKPAVDTPANVLHVSDCLHDLTPGDHIEIQWRRNKGFPYGMFSKLSRIPQTLACFSTIWKEQLHHNLPGTMINAKCTAGWWYGVVGHLEPCDARRFHCQCHSSDTVVLEFKQYSPGSRWRQKLINREDHREVGDEANGFYGGIRKLYNEEEISMWRRLWPNQVLE